MALKIALILCSVIVCTLIEHSTAEDLLAVQSHNDDYYHDDDHGELSKKYDGGHNNGQDNWGKGQHKKYHLKSFHRGKKEHGKDNKWGANKWNKHGLNHHGNKWSQAQGGDKKKGQSEWANNEKWHTDKGQGFVKNFVWDKSDGHKNSIGKKGNFKDNHFKHSHGGKEGLMNHKDAGADKHGYNHMDSDKEWKDWLNSHENYGDRKHRNKHWIRKYPKHYMHKKFYRDNDHDDHYDHDNHEEEARIVYDYRIRY